jgi:hypothetical protein
MEPQRGTPRRVLFWIAVRGSWLSVQVLSEDRKSPGVPVAYLLLRMCPPVRRASASSGSCDYSRTSGKPSLTDTNPFLALFPFDKISLAESQKRSIFGFQDRRRRTEARISAYRVHREPFGTAGRMRLAGTTPEPSSTE